MVDPTLLCRKHLLGEHVECHMFRGSLLKGTSLRGFLESGLLDSRLLARRHDQLAKELQGRGYRHESPLPRDFDTMAARGAIDAGVDCRSWRRGVTSANDSSWTRRPRRPEKPPWSRDAQRSGR